MIDNMNVINFYKELSEIKCPDKRIDFIFEKIDDAFLAGNFVIIDELLEQTDVRKLSILDLISLLSITAAAKEKLLNRPVFVKEVREYLELTETPERVFGLLSGLE